VTQGAPVATVPEDNGAPQTGVSAAVEGDATQEETVVDALEELSFEHLRGDITAVQSELAVLTCCFDSAWLLFFSGRSPP